jgi:hypothetical protein
MSSKLASRVIFASFVMLAAGAMPACSCNANGRNGGHGGNGGTGGGTGGTSTDMAQPLSGSISVTPSDVTLDLVQGMPPPTQDFKVTIHDPNGDRDVTLGSTFVIADTTLGTMSSNTFVAGTSHGGTTALTASYTPPNMGQQQAQAMIHIRVKGTFPGPDCGGMGQPACPTFPGDSAPPCAASVAKPHIVYPPDGVLLPPNMSVISVQWTPFASPAVKSYEVAFQNMTTDVRIVTTCSTQTLDENVMPPKASGGCEVQLSPAQWDFIAKSNRGGAPVGVEVRASSDGMCATPSDNSANISFAEQDLNGGLFYWKSTIANNGTGGVGGQIWAKSFGDATPEDQITGKNNLQQTCYGCHSLSRDGKQMMVDADDDDSDDEYTDVNSTLVDVMSKSALDDQQGPAGFQVLNPNHDFYIGTNGLPTGAGNVFFLNSTANAMMRMPTTLTLSGLMSTQRPTMPDWSPDGKTIIFVLPQSVAMWKGTYGDALADDDHVFGGSLYTVSWDPMAHTLGVPKAFVTSAGENNYYPTFSPDGTFIAFNRVPMQPGGTTCAGGFCPNDSYSNPKARVLIMANKSGAMPVDIENANGSKAASPVDYSNSWPRWSPFVQTYRGSQLLWITFSSTRDYGLRVLNHKTGMVQCYPPDSAEHPGDTHGTPFASNCQQPQIWMAAINLQQVELGQMDPSYPAFWLPFQDVTTHNHTAQWTQTVVTLPPNDMGMCIANGANCQSNPNACCSMTCLGTGVCGNPIP